METSLQPKKGYMRTLARHLYQKISVQTSRLKDQGLSLDSDETGSRDTSSLNRADVVARTVYDGIWPPTVALSALCNDCKAIPVLELLKNLYTTTEEPYYMNFSASHVHKTSLSALQSSSQCSLCLQISVMLEEDITNVFGLNISDFKDIPITMKISSAGNIYDTQAVFSDQIKLGYISAIFYCHLADSMIRWHIPGRLVNPHSTPDELIATARKWLEECDSSECGGCQSFHSICRRPVGVLPSRVLDIGPPLQSQGIRLLDPSSSIIAPYVALSHCWGLNQSFTTTVENLMERKKGIEVAQMPQTFQDAVLVTRLMGFRYLWIDSLCILQNHEEDWLRESALMGPVYKNANFVIGAARAAADTEGFLQPRIPPEVMIATETPTTIGTHERILFIPYRNLIAPMEVRGTAGSSIPAEPLSTRAWTLQERHLARRTLFFGREQMFWECQVLVADEYGRRTPRGDNLFGIAEESCSPSLPESTSADLTPHLRKKPFDTWNHVIEHYIKMDLTKESDRLPAVSGLAAAIGDVTGDEYIAGIWLRDLDTGLLWSRCLYDPRSSPLWTCSELSRPKLYRAPSWSWAAVDGAREFLAFASSSDKILFSHVSHRIDNDGESRYGPVIGGYLELKGPVFPVTKNFRLSPRGREFYISMDLEGKFTNFKLCYEQLIEVTINDLNGHIAATFDVPSEDRRNLFAFFMVQKDDNTSHPVHLGLIIRATGQNPELYTRVGIINGVFMHVPDMPENPETYCMAELPSFYAELRYRRYGVYVPRLEVPLGLRLVAPDLGNCKKTIVTLF